MSYRIAGIDVHKKILAVVDSDVEVDSEYQFERRMFASAPWSKRIRNPPIRGQDDFRACSAHKKEGWVKNPTLQSSFLAND